MFHRLRLIVFAKKVVLLNAGILWLAIEDLMVNGVALVTIINVDERLWPKGKWHKCTSVSAMASNLRLEVAQGTKLHVTQQHNRLQWTSIPSTKLLSINLSIKHA